MKIQKVLAFDIGGTKIAWAIVDRHGKIISDVNKHATPVTNEAIFTFLKSTIEHYENDVEAIAISTAGTVSRDYKRILGSVGNLPDGYADTDFQALSAKPMFVTNDANAAVWAEYKLGNAKGAKNVVLMTLGTGVGVGLIVDGKLLVGKSGAAGEVHFPVRGDQKRRCGCGRYDCLEIYMSGKALNLDAKEFYQDDSANSYEVIKGLKENNPKAIKAFEHWQNMVKLGVVMFADIFDPEIILLGGSMAHFINYPKLNADANVEIITSPIILKEAAFENDAGIVGASLLAVDYLK